MKKQLLSLAAVVSCATVYSATVSMDTFCGDTEITQAEFEKAQNAAGNGGIIELSKRWYKINGKLIVKKSNLSLVGLGRADTFVTYKGGGKIAAMFITDKDGFKLQQMTVRGDKWPTYPADKPIEIVEGARVISGVEAAVRVNDGALNMKAVDVTFTKVSVGIEYNLNTFPDGLEVTDSKFVTGRNMINARDGGDNDVNYTFLSKMKIDNADFFLQPGLGCRGITLDFGNTSSSSLIDMKWSYIKNCTMDNAAFFNIDINRVENVNIQKNELYGGGGGSLREKYVHALHFEDHSKNIVVQWNTIHQRKKNAAGVELSGVGHIFGCGNNGYPQLIVKNNTFTGSAANGVLSQHIENWVVKDNKFNIDKPYPEYVINGWHKGSTVKLQGNNTLNGASLPASRVRVNP